MDITRVHAQGLDLVKLYLTSDPMILNPNLLEC